MANTRKQSDPDSTNHHHLWEPASNYTTELEKAFRNHPAFVLLVNADGHELWNRHRSHPDKPSEQEMRDFLNEHPVKDFRRKRLPAELTARSISAAKGIVALVYQTSRGIKQIVKVSCTNCKEHTCFQPVIEILEPEPDRNNKRRKKK